MRLVIDGVSYYTEAELQAAIREARAQAIEDCAKLVQRRIDAHASENCPDDECCQDLLLDVPDLLRALSTPSEATALCKGELGFPCYRKAGHGGAHHSRPLRDD